MTALEVHAIPPQAKPGHFPWDLAPNSTMTNANLDGIAQASGGNEITLNYQGGSQKIAGAAGHADRRLRPGLARRPQAGRNHLDQRAHRKRGKIIVERLNVSKDGVKPPH